MEEVGEGWREWRLEEVGGTLRNLGKEEVGGGWRLKGVKIESRLEVLAVPLLFWPCCFWSHLKTEDLAAFAAKPDPQPAHRAIITLLEKYTAISKFRCWLLFLP